MRDPNQKITVHKDGRVSVETINNEPTMTQQQYKDECDINNIMHKYSTTGQFTHLTSRQGAYADFSQITDYREMLDTVRYAQEAFASLPAEVRKRFSNDPSQLLDFIQDDNNYDEGVKLGLLNPKLTPEQQTPPQPNANKIKTNATKPKTPPSDQTPEDPS